MQVSLEWSGASHAVLPPSHGEGGTPNCRLPTVKAGFSSALAHILLRYRSTASGVCPTWASREGQIYAHNVLVSRTRNILGRHSGRKAWPM